MLVKCCLRAPQAIITYQQGHVFPTAAVAALSPPPAAFCRSSSYSSKLHCAHLRLVLAASCTEGILMPEDDGKALQPRHRFPLIRGLKRVQEQLVNTLFSTGKWLLVVIAVQYTLSEVAYALVHSQELLVPSGMLVGVTFAGVAGEVVQELYGDKKYGELPFYLMMLFFALIKLSGPALPIWGLVFLPHFANGGLWQTYLWRKNKKSANVDQYHEKVLAS
ncbi:hypothetical protein O6H91_13G020900 [Diphasiastrum complanatum]|uniref:Uncharacterized protein n=1 Tax=Diphasiastrum complanatum TaxID=34168 RepID=A0ACC2BTE8_DIPCM|nr:hypothetical protein O6H91_13G020900 [Diphasiastrum complanatum]